MSRKGGPDEMKLKKINRVLKENPGGLWVREIARKAGLDKSTVSIYLERHLADKIEEVFATDNQWIKIVRLKK